jgi:undecaprenyl-diphosphatase
MDTSLHMADAVIWRLAVLVLLLMLLVCIVVWSTSAAIRFGVPRVRQWRDATVQWAHLHDSRIAHATLLLLDPQRPASHALLLGSLLLLGAGWLFLGVVEDILSGDPLVLVDQAVFHLLQGLRTRSVDIWMVAITDLGGVRVLLPLIGVVLAWLLFRRCWRTAAYWLAAVSFGELLVQLLKYTLGRRRPVDLYTGVEQFSFPSGHATASTVVLAFLAFLLCRNQAPRTRLAISAVAGVYVVLVGFSRLYLGAHWLSDVVGGMSLAIAWVSFVAMVYTQRQIEEDIEPRGLLVTVVLALVILGGASIHWAVAHDLHRYQSS